MDDLLIVRASERIRPRRHERRADQVPLGASLGMVIGVACGFLGAVVYSANPTFGLMGGIGVGVIIGGLIGPLLRPKSKRIPRYSQKHYDGFPFPKEETVEAEKPKG